eukprot:7041662-Alexandrium_andersonii.AAC.1
MGAECEGREGGVKLRGIRGSEWRGGGQAEGRCAYRVWGGAKAQRNPSRVAGGCRRQRGQASREEGP